MNTLTCSWCDAPNAAGATTCTSCGAPLREEGARLVMESVARALPPDTMLRDGDYKILAILGQGGFGITYRALNSRLGREVAIKEFFPSSCDREGLLVSPSGGTTAIDYENGKAAFLAEARVLARFDHPAIVRVFGAWEENRSAYMEMELLRGQTLAHVLDQYRRLNPNDVLRLFNPILDALQVLHNEGYLHRDIKPQNLMLCGVAQGATDAESCVRHARAVLLDFGAAHHVGSGASQALSVVVTPGYAPLEQYAQRARRGAFTDIYALCATLYHALSGQTPPPASDRAIGQALTPLEDLVSGLPREWYAAIAAGLQTEIAKRPQSVGELRALMGGQNPAVPPPYQPYSGAAKPYGADDLSALMNVPPPQIPSAGANNPSSQAQSLIAQSLMNAVPDLDARQVLAAPNLHPQHPLGANTPGQPVALSQPSSAVPLVPPQASQNAQTPYQQQQSAAQQHTQNQAQHNNAANDVRMRQIAALLYLGSPIVFALLWWLFAVSQGPLIPPPMPIDVPPPIMQPHHFRHLVPVSQRSPQMSFPPTKPALSPDGKSSSALDANPKWFLNSAHGNIVGISARNSMKSWQWIVGYDEAFRDDSFQFAPDNSWLMARIYHTNIAPIGERIAFFDLKTGKVMKEWKDEPNKRYGRGFDFTISPQGRYVVIRQGTNALRIWDVHTHKDTIVKWKYRGDDSSYDNKNPSNDGLGHHLSFSPDESKMVFFDTYRGWTNNVCLIDLVKQTVNLNSVAMPDAKLQMQFASDGKSIFWQDATTGSSGRLKISDFKSLAFVQVLAGAPPKP